MDIDPLAQRACYRHANGTELNKLVATKRPQSRREPSRPAGQPAEEHGCTGGKPQDLLFGVEYK
jgi:hypothetical protein